MTADFDPTTGPVTLARPTIRGVGVAVVAWSVYAIVYSAAVAVFAGVPFVYIVVTQGGQAALMAVLSLPIWWVAVRRMAEAPVWRVVLVHAGGASISIGAVVAGTLAWASLGGEAAYETVRARAGWIGLWTGILYVAQFAIYHAVEASRRARVRRAQAEALRHLARDQELRTLRSQLNPHFLFNALNTISAEVVRDPEAAREALGRLADLLRYALDAGRRNLVPLGDEMAFVRDYLALEQARMGDRLGVRLDVDPDAHGAEVPPMAVQTLVENAVRHGLAPSRDGGTVTVRAHLAGAHAEVEVADDGVGADTMGEGIGLANTAERLRLLFGPEADVEIDTDRPEGFAVRLRIPLPDAMPASATALVPA
ncbi:MAG: histidine kinase [Bacteroidota bacterium]